MTKNVTGMLVTLPKKLTEVMHYSNKYLKTSADVKMMGAFGAASWHKHRE